MGLSSIFQDTILFRISIGDAHPDFVFHIYLTVRYTLFLFRIRASLI
jgi:hypothetical protein